MNISTLSLKETLVLLAPCLSTCTPNTSSRIAIALKADLFSISLVPTIVIEEAELIAFSAFLDPEITTSSNISPDERLIETTSEVDFTLIVWF